MRPAAAGLRGLNASQATTREGQFISFILLRKPYLYTANPTPSVRLVWLGRLSLVAPYPQCQ